MYPRHIPHEKPHYIKTISPYCTPHITITRCIRMFYHIEMLICGVQYGEIEDIITHITHIITPHITITKSTLW